MKKRVTVEQEQAPVHAKKEWKKIKKRKLNEWNMKSQMVAKIPKVFIIINVNLNGQNLWIKSQDCQPE